MTRLGPRSRGPGGGRLPGLGPERVPAGAGPAGTRSAGPAGQSSGSCASTALLPLPRVTEVAALLGYVHEARAGQGVTRPGIMVRAAAAVNIASQPASPEALPAPRGGWPPVPAQTATPGSPGVLVQNLSAVAVPTGPVFPAGGGVSSLPGSLDRRQISRCTGISRGTSRRPGMKGTASRSNVAAPVM